LPFCDNHNGSYAAARNIDMTLKTQQPNVELDCRNTSATLEIPWVGPAPWLDLIETSISWGRIYIDVLSPLATGTSGSTVAEVSVFAYFKDVEFAAPICPQSGDKKTFRKTTKVSSEHELDEVADLKPISTVLNAASKVALYAGRVPMLSSMATPAAWVLRYGSKLASSFGWSKPNLTTPPQFVVQRAYHNMGNAEGTSQAEPLSLTAQPELTVLPGFGGSDIDEMSWDYIKSIPAFVNQFSFPTSASPGDNLYYWDITPAMGQLYTSTATTTCQYKTAPPFCYVSRCFRYWRGSIKLILKFIKTDFHSGRLLVTFSPTDNSSLTLPTVDTSSYSMRTIVDLREVTEVEIMLPYTIARCWQSQQAPSGRVAINVLNTLQAPASVASNVDVLCYYAAGDDFELSFPQANRSQPYTPQSGDSQDIGKPNTKVAGVIGNDPASIPMVEQYTVGEKFTSLKQLINKYSRVYFGNTSFDAAVAVLLWPWTIGFINGNEGGDISQGQMLGDTYSYLAAGFALARGGMKYAYQPGGNANVTADYSQTAFEDLQTFNPGTVYPSTSSVPASTQYGGISTQNKFVFFHNGTTTYTPTTASVANFSNSQFGCEVLIPASGMNPSRFIIPNCYASWTNILATYPEQVVPHGALVFDCLGTSSTRKMFRAAAEDGQLGYFIGFPAAALYYN